MVRWYGQRPPNDGLRQYYSEMPAQPNTSCSSARTVSPRIGRETVQYVSNIYKYYLAYQLVIQSGQLKEQAKQKMTS